MTENNMPVNETTRLFIREDKPQLKKGYFDKCCDLIKEIANNEDWPIRDEEAKNLAKMFFKNKKKEMAPYIQNDTFFYPKDRMRKFIKKRIVLILALKKAT